MGFKQAITHIETGGRVEGGRGGSKAEIINADGDFLGRRGLSVL